MDDHTRAEIEHLRASLGGWALGDVKKAATAGIPMGAFILGAHFIDTLARLARTKSDGRAAWDEFVPKYLPRYVGHAYTLYSGFRGATSHHYSAQGIRFVDGQTNTLRHWLVEDGERVLHLETFIEDVEAAWQEFLSDLEDDEAFRGRVLERAREKPPLGIRGGQRVNAGDVLRVVGNNPTHFGQGTFPAARSASASYWPVEVRGEADTFGFEPPPKEPPKRAIPKTKKPGKRKG